MNLLTHRPQILSGPFGSEAAKRGTSTQELFAKEQLSVAEAIHRSFKNAGTTTGVASTFAAAPRGLEEKPFTPELSQWNARAVKVARRVFGNDIFASIAPMLDTSGSNDADWVGLDADWSRRRHEGQATALRTQRVTRALGEAFRYVKEAKALAVLLEELGFEEFVCSFEARHEQGRVPHQPQLTYEQVKNELVSATKGMLRIGVGVNCASVGDCERVLQHEPTGVIDAAYPNKAKIGNNDLSLRFIHLAEKNGNRTAIEQAEFDSLSSKVEHSKEELLGLLRLCLEKRVRYVGVCCGGTPEDVASLSTTLQRLTSKDPT